MPGKNSKVGPDDYDGMHPAPNMQLGHQGQIQGQGHVDLNYGTGLVPVTPHPSNPMLQNHHQPGPSGSNLGLGHGGPSPFGQGQSQGYQEKMPGGPSIMQPVHNGQPMGNMANMGQFGMQGKPNTFPPGQSLEHQGQYIGQSNMAMPQITMQADGLIPSAPQAPSFDNMQKIAGYHNVGFEASEFVPPPPTYDESVREPANRNWENCVPKFDEAELRAALSQYVAEQSCYGKSAARDLQFTNLNHKSAYHYILETFGEKRSTSWNFIPFFDQPVDGPEMGRAPQPWEIPVQRPELFKDTVYTLSIPHTASVKVCHVCIGSGQIICPYCNGRGEVTCSSCNGSGYTGMGDDRQSCSWCSNGSTRCQHCSATGLIICTTCQGKQKVVWFIQLTIFWKNHVSDPVILHSELPNYLVRTVSGETIFREEQPRVAPLARFPEQEVNDLSKSLIHEHNTIFLEERLHMQRHTVRVVPVTQALYTWNGESSDFFVYGLEKKVHAPNYPQQCCWGCSIV